MTPRAPGRSVAKLLRALFVATSVAGVVATTTGCESVLHWCLNGQYGAPYYARSVRPIPAELRSSVAGMPSGPLLDKDLCAKLCASDGDVCQLAALAELPETSHVVCFSYRENGCPSGWGSGRLPDGLAVRPGRAPSLGDTFARAAVLEAASVVSFRRLAKDLERHGAPRALVRRAVLAARDEKRHAALTRRLARRFGGVRVRATVDAARPRALRELALENAREGCVGETLGALLLSARVHASDDAEVRATLREIARDEIAHAAFAWDLRAFLLERLDAGALADERHALAEARDAARRVPVDPVFPFDPAPLARALDERLWQPALELSVVVREDAVRRDERSPS